MQINSMHATRPWQHVLDVVNGYLSAVKFMSDQPRGSYDCFNIGPMQENVADVLSLTTKDGANPGEAAYGPSWLAMWGNRMKPSFSSLTYQRHFTI